MISGVCISEAQIEVRILVDIRDDGIANNAAEDDLDWFEVFRKCFRHCRTGRLTDGDDAKMWSPMGFGCGRGVRFRGRPCRIVSLKPSITRLEPSILSDGVVSEEDL